MPLQSFKSALQPWALLSLRIAIGVGFMVHGIAKWNRGPANFAKLLNQIGTPLPVTTAWLVTLLEIFGGLAIILGVFTAIVIIPLIVSMLVAMFTIHVHYGFSSVNTIGLTPTGPLFGPPGYEINLLYIGGLMALALSPPGAFSVDRWREHRKSSRQHRIAESANSAPSIDSN